MLAMSIHVYVDVQRNKFAVVISDGVTPVPIPNTEVKPVSADGTWGATPWESRTPPDFSIIRSGIVNEADKAR